MKTLKKSCKIEGLGLFRSSLIPMACLQVTSRPIEDNSLETAQEFRKIRGERQQRQPVVIYWLCNPDSRLLSNTKSRKRGVYVISITYLILTDVFTKECEVLSS
mmetsp:Transcript_8882/g.16342  ORF Transcript_8882/g.16342 Transcript_8882/m.16342 type:complete len:104 (+) Transcript_8882:108-419(+)